MRFMFSVLWNAFSIIVCLFVLLTLAIVCLSCDYPFGIITLVYSFAIFICCSNMIVTLILNVGGKKSLKVPKG